MERLNSWQTIKQTFSPFPQLISVKALPKRKRITAPRRKTEPISAQKERSFRLNDVETSTIEDSDEENLYYNEICAGPPQSRSKKSKYVPLIARTSSNQQPVSNDSEEVIEASAIKSNIQIDGCQRTNNSTSTMKTDLTNIQNVFNGTRVANEQAALEDSIIDSDTDEDDDAGQHSMHVSLATAAPLAIHSNSLKSNLDIIPSSSQQAIEYCSSFGSIPYHSQCVANQKSPKRTKVIKGGLVELLHRSIRKSKTDHSFWMNERHATLVMPGERVRIEKIEPTYGRILVHCVPLMDANNDVKIFCLDPQSKKLPFLNVGKTIEVEFNTNGYRLDSRTLCFPNIINIF